MKQTASLGFYMILPLIRLVVAAYWEATSIYAIRSGNRYGGIALPLPLKNLQTGWKKTNLTSCPSLDITTNDRGNTLDIIIGLNPLLSNTRIKIASNLVCPSAVHINFL